MRFTHENMHAVCAWGYECPAIDLKPGAAKDCGRKRERLNALTGEYRHGAMYRSGS